VHKYERSGMSIGSALQAAMLDPGAGWLRRGTAAKMLAIADARGAVARLLNLFFTQKGKAELWETALAIEHGTDRTAVPRLADALYDENPDRRHAAARALGWIRPVSRRAAKALVEALPDKSQPQPVREEAAESLAYSHYVPAIPPLISVLDEPDVRMRFWAVFALGGIGQWQTYAPRGRGRWRRSADPRVIGALERMLQDEEAPPGNWWSVGREALAMLGHLEPRYEGQLDTETQRVLRDPNSSAEDLRWAEGYRRASRS
jgi:HEAT repeat protein